MGFPAENFMTNLQMLVGLPGCGKSSYTSQKLDEYKIFSSDEIRNRFDIWDYSKEGNSKVFNLLHKEIRSALENGDNCIYDATNMGRKERMGFLETIKDIPNVRKECVLFAIPIYKCKLRNSQRTGREFVPDEVYDRMVRRFQCPYYYEGWEVINIIEDDEIYIPDWIWGDMFSNFYQDNPYHSMTLGEHMVQAYTYMEYVDKQLSWVALHHDIGKNWTKTFTNAKGEQTSIAHYYHHENVGAYEYLTAEINDMAPSDKKTILYETCLINWHMKPYAWKNNNQLKIKDKQMIGKKMFDDIMKLYIVDQASH